MAHAVSFRGGFALLSKRGNFGHLSLRSNYSGSYGWFYLHFFIILIYQELILVAAIWVVRVLGAELSESGYPTFWFSRRHSSTINKTLWSSGSGNRQEICFLPECGFKSGRCFFSLQFFFFSH